MDNNTNTETLARTHSITGFTGPIPKCAYCKQYLTSNEFDFGMDCDGPYEPSFYSAHQRCVQPVKMGRFEVVTRQHAVSPVRENIRSYTTRARAVEVAQDCRDWNPRSRPCGVQLEIIVRERLA